MMGTILLWSGRVTLPVLLLAGLVLGSRLPLGEAPAHGELRLAWRMVSAQVELCRPYTEEEKERLPEHMRRGANCERSLLPYRLRVAVDGEARLDEVVRPAGLRGDRPLYVQESLPLEPGRHRLAVAFVPAAQAARAGRESADAARALDEALARAQRLTFERTVLVCAGRIALLDLRDDALRLVNGCGATAALLAGAADR